MRKGSKAAAWMVLSNRETEIERNLETVKSDISFTQGELYRLGRVKRDLEGELVKVRQKMGR